MTTNEIETAEKALAKARRAYEKASAAREKAMHELTLAMRQADAAGMSRSQIQRQAGVARQTVYDAVSVPAAPALTSLPGGKA